MAAAFPSACGKTNMAMLIPTLPGWKIETVGDDICWMKFGADGRLYATNPEAGFFGVAPGTSEKTNPNAVAMLTDDCVFTNVAETDDGDIWWEGLTDTPPAHLNDWKGQDWTPESGTPAAHPNARFTVVGRPVPVDRPRVGGPGRRADLGHPVRRPAGDQRAARDRVLRLGARRVPRLDHELGDHRRPGRRRREAALRPLRHAAVLWLQHGRLLRHWLEIGAATDAEKLPKLFWVNWFRRGDDGSFLWPGFGENSRVLKWIIERVDGRGRGGRHPDRPGARPRARSTPTGLDVDPAVLAELTTVDRDKWRAELPQIEAHYETFGERLPGRPPRPAEGPREAPRQQLASRSGSR